VNDERKNLQESVDGVKKYGSVAAAAKALKIPRKTLSGRYNKALDKGYIAGTPQLSEEQEIGLDSKLKTVVKEKRDLQSKYNELIKLFDEQKNQNSVIEQMAKNLDSIELDKINIKKETSITESTAIIMCSDLHFEETIDPRTVDGLNEYNTDIAKKRFKKLFQNVLRLIEINRHGTEIRQCVLALLGDFISGYIHEELMENNSMSPVEASIEVYKLLVSAIEFLMENGKFEKIIVVTNVGNHSRTTDKIRISTCVENNFEWLIYNFLVTHFEKSNIVQFKLSRGYFNWINIYGYDLRMHHGNYIKYGGGMGGITIPANKAIAQWDQSKPAYLDLFAHWHQLITTKKMICNGSIIGYGPYSLSIKASFEKPQQFMFLMSSKHGRTIQMPIFLE